MIIIKWLDVFCIFLGHCISSFWKSPFIPFFFPLVYFYYPNYLFWTLIKRKTLSVTNIFQIVCFNFFLSFCIWKFKHYKSKLWICFVIFFFASKIFKYQNHMYLLSLLLYLFLIDWWLCDDIGFISVTHQHELAIGVHMSPLSWTSFHLPPSPTPSGCYKAQPEFSVIQKISIGFLFYMC